MQPMFTIHAGEYLVGSYIEQNLTDQNGKKLNIWVPSKDIGIDLLVTDQTNRHTTSIQVKFPKDFLPTDADKREYQNDLKACGWWKLNRKQIRNSKADYWILVIPSFRRKEPQYVILTHTQLVEKLDATHPKGESVNFYLWIGDGKDSRYWETRNLKKTEKDELVFHDKKVSNGRDYGEFLNNWNSLFEKWI